MKKIYIVLTYSGTFVSKLIRLYTRKKYSHVSISLDKDLHSMYSFGRRHPYNPFWGGFVHEAPNKGIFKRFKKTLSVIYSLDVTDEEYHKIKTVIEEFSQNKNCYHYNYLGVVAAILNKKLNREKCFYCSEFVKYVLDCSDLNIDLPEVVKPTDFQKIENLNLVYTGLLNEY